MKLSIGMMVKNEEKHLEQCLKSLQPILNSLKSELIIIDTGSTDNTVQIAVKYTNKLHHHPWTNNFAEMRNLTIGYAKGEWFGYFDADEVVENPSEIIKFFKSNVHKKYNSACVAIKSILNDTMDHSAATGHALRFFRNDKSLCFDGIVHEQPRFKYPIYSIPTTVLHYGYLSTDTKLMEEKYQRNIALLKTAIEQEPDNIYHWFQLSQSYGMYKKREEGLKAIIKAYEILEKRNESKKKYIYVLNHLAKTYFNNKMYNESIDLSNEGIDINYKYIDFYYYRASSFFELKKYEQAISDYYSYLKLLSEYKKNGGLIDLSVSHATLGLQERAYKSLCVSYKMLGNHKMALEYAQKVNNPLIYKDIVPVVLGILIEDKQWQKLISLYEERICYEQSLEQIFARYMEDKRKDMTRDEQREIADKFKRYETVYGLLNKVRSDYLEKNMGKSYGIYCKIKELDLENVDSFYGEILFYIIRHQFSLLPLFKQVKESAINEFLAHIFDVFDETSQELVNYLNRYDEINKEYIDEDELIRIQVVLYRGLLIYGTLDDSEYDIYFKDYVRTGSQYISLVYSPEVISQEKVAWTRTGMDGFLLYMSLVNKVNTASPEYVRYLKKAVQQDKSMKRGIELLVKEIENNSMPDKTIELELHKKTILQTIEKYINAGDIETAKKLVEEYEIAVGTDAKLDSIKSIILIIEQNYSEAERFIKEAQERYGDNYDLIYNLIYVKEQMGYPVENELMARLDNTLGTRRCINPEIADSFFHLLNSEGIRYALLDTLTNEFIKETQDRSMHILMHDEDRARVSRYFVPYDDSIPNYVWVHSIRDLEEQTWGVKLPVKAENNLWNERKQNSDGIYYIDEEVINKITLNINDTAQGAFWCSHSLKQSFLRLTFKPEITIETSAYNAEKYIEECINSIVNQTFTNFEWVILENGSSDNTSDILLELAKNDYRVKLFRNEKNTLIYNEPPNSSFLKYRDELCSRYYTRIDSDDFYHKDFIKELYSIAKKYDADFAVGGTMAFKDSNPSERWKIWKSEFQVNDVKMLGHIFPDIYGSFSVYWNKLFKTSMVKKVWAYRKENPIKLQNAGDTLFNLDCLKIAKNAVGINKELYYYRLRKDSLVHSQVNKNRYLDYLIVFKQALQLLKDWKKDNLKNIEFLVAELYRSMINCLTIAVYSESVPLEERKQVIITIREDDEVKKIMYNFGLWERFYGKIEEAMDKLLRLP